MEQAKKFILRFFDKEAECWTKRHLTDLDSFNQSINGLYSMAIDDLDQGLGIYYRKELAGLEDTPLYKPRHLYKLSSYNNKVYGDIWVAYASGTNPRSEITRSVFFQGFIIAEIERELKVIGTMIIDMNRSTMKITGWRTNVYNPSDLDIKKLGKFTATERYAEPGNYDNWSLEEYLKDR